MIGQGKVGFGAQMARRSVLRLGAGGLLAAGLAACGGGGGGDSTADKQQSLRDAFAKLRDGMVAADVEALVGFPANDTRTLLQLTWQFGDVNLFVGFVSTGSKVISSATLRESRNDFGQTRTFQV